jgi:hypothetical protein
LRGAKLHRFNANPKGLTESAGSNFNFVLVVEEGEQTAAAAAHSNDSTGGVAGTAVKVGQLGP